MKRRHRSKRMVVSAVNLVEGGTLTVLQEFVRAASRLADWRIVTLIHDRSLIPPGLAHSLVLPGIKRAWWRRILFEWVRSRSLSRRLDADLWVSLHDMTANVVAKRQVVYCHNPSPFHRLSAREAWYSPSFALFCLFYIFLYRVRIRRNWAVVVQQEWLRVSFRDRWGLANVIVAHPGDADGGVPLRRQEPRIRRFAYPALPRVFKNIELIGEAVAILERDPDWDGEVALTFDRHEGRYAARLWSDYGNLRSLKFVGRQTKPQMDQLYATTDCLLFPSKLETWGLPITEFKRTGRPMIVADLPYAHETVGDYAMARFVSAGSAEALAAAMLAANRGAFVPDRTSRIAHPVPFAGDWDELLRLITQPGTLV